MNNDEQIRALALKFQSYQSGIDPAFDEQVKGFIETIELYPISGTSCPACERRACGVCGKCHEAGKPINFLGPHCPLIVENEEKACTAWVWAFQFLKNAENQLDGRNVFGQKVNTTDNQ